MADKKISALTAASTPLAGTEVLPIVQSSATVKVAVSDLTAGRSVSMSSATLTGANANTVVYLDGSKVTTTNTNFKFDGTRLYLGSSTLISSEKFGVTFAAGDQGIAINVGSGASQTQILFANAFGSVGSITTSGSATAYNTSSDYRLKDNIQPMSGALAVVAKLKPVTYTWKVDGSAGQGFIAHELQAVVPECVTGEKDAMRFESYEISPTIPATYDKNGNELTPAIEAVMGKREVPAYQGVDTSFLIATLTAAIQELKTEFDAYKASHP